MATVKDNRLQTTNNPIIQKRKMDYINAAMLMNLAEFNDIECVIKANSRYCRIQNRSGNTYVFIYLL